MIRRRFIGMLPLAGLARRPKQEAAIPGEARVEVWEWENCPGCERQVAFLPGQHVNKCAWCRKKVRH